MMENRPPLTSPDGSSSRNSPERCPSPLYSWNSMRQRHKVLRCYQYKRLKHLKTEVKEEAEETYLRGDDLCKKEERSPEISTDSSGTSVTPIKAEEEVEGNVKIKEEKTPPEISTDPGDIQRDINSGEEEEGHVRNKEEPEEPSLMGNELCKEEELSPEISTDLENSRLTQRNVKTEEKDEGHLNIKQEKVPPEISIDPGDARVTQAEEENRQMKTKRKILEIGMDGRYRWYNIKEHPNVPPEGEIVDDEITAYVLEAKAVTPNLKPFTYKEEKAFACPECGKCFSRKYDRIMHRRTHTGQESFLCPECGKSFPFKSNLEMHQKTHTAQTKPFTCSECGMRFRNSLILATHKRVHGAKTVYNCSQCGLAFIKKSYLKRHEKIHMGLKPY